MLATTWVVYSAATSTLLVRSKTTSLKVKLLEIILMPTNKEDTTPENNKLVISIRSPIKLAKANQRLLLAGEGSQISKSLTNQATLENLNPTRVISSRVMDLRLQIGA